MINIIKQFHLRVILKHKWTVMVVTAVVIASTYWWSGRQVPEYRSSAIIKIQRLQTFADLFDQVLVSSGDPMDNYIYEITSDQVIQQASRRLATDGHPTEPKDLSGSVTATRKERTDLIDIVIKGPSSDAARRRCEAIVQAFIDVHDRMITRNADEEYADIQQSLTNTLASLSKLDSDFRNKVGAIPSLTAEEGRTKVLLAKQADATVRLQELHDAGNYTEEFPEIVSLKATIAAVETQLKQINSSDFENQVAFREYEQKKKIHEEMATFLTKRMEETRLSRSKKSERVEEIEQAHSGTPITTARAYLTAIGALLGLMLGIIFAFIAENLDTSIRTLVEIEETFHLPILGVIPHFSPHDVEVPIRPEGFFDRIRYIGSNSPVAVIWRAAASAIRHRLSHDKSPAVRASLLIVPFSPRAPATEGYRAVRTNIQLAAGDGKIGAILVTSAGPAEGKSTTISNLAFAFAQAGKKTLLVSANMRRPSLCRTFGLSRERGLSEILVGDLSWREALKDNRDLAIGERADEGLGTAVGAENLFIITCGGRTIQPSEWLSLPIFEATVREWTQEFDIVLIDGPPLLPVPDSVIMSAAIGKVLLVYQAGTTQRDSMLRAISLVQKTGAKIDGMVLNDLRAAWGTGPDSFHYRGYYGRAEKP